MDSGASVYLKDAMIRLKHDGTYFANPKAAFVANFLGPVVQN